VDARAPPSWTASRTAKGYQHVGHLRCQHHLTGFQIVRHALGTESRTIDRAIPIGDRHVAVCHPMHVQWLDLDDDRLFLPRHLASLTLGTSERRSQADGAAMRVMFMVKGDPAPGAAPSDELLAAMGRYNDELKNAGVLLDLSALYPSANGRREGFRAATEP
jgi:hypothetical protein